MHRPPSQQGLLPPPPPPPPPPPRPPPPLSIALPSALALAPSRPLENGGGEGETGSGSEFSSDSRQRWRRRRPFSRQRLFFLPFEVAAALLRRGATALVSCVGIRGKEGSSSTHRASAVGFLARRRQQQHEQQQQQRLSLSLASSAAAETGKTLHPAPGNVTATATRAKAMPSASSSAAAAVAALSAARDAAALHLSSRAALDDFERLRSRALRSAPLPCDAALHSSNRRKNRYSDVLAPDHSRVVLLKSMEEVVARGGTTEGGGGGGEGARTASAAANEQQEGELSPSRSPSSSSEGYINASLLSSRPGEHPAWSYVAAQGPLTSTIVDFWTLVAQLRSPVVVSLTRPEERGVEKCARYLPPTAYGDKISTQRGEENDFPHSAVFGDFKVSCGRAEAAGPGARHATRRCRDRFFFFVVLFFYLPALAAAPARRRLARPRRSGELGIAPGRRGGDARGRGRSGSGGCGEREEEEGRRGSRCWAPRRPLLRRCVSLLLFLRFLFCLWLFILRLSFLTHRKKHNNNNNNLQGSGGPARSSPSTSPRAGSAPPSRKRRGRHPRPLLPRLRLPPRHSLPRPAPSRCAGSSAG